MGYRASYQTVHNAVSLELYEASFLKASQRC